MLTATYTQLHEVRFIVAVNILFLRNVQTSCHMHIGKLAEFTQWPQILAVIAMVQ